MSFFVHEYKHVFVAISFVCVMILLYYLVYKPSALSQSVNSMKLVKSGQQAITTLGSGCGKQLSSKQLSSKQVADKQVADKQVADKQVAGKPLSSRQLSGQSPHAYSDSDYD